MAGLAVPPASVAVVAGAAAALAVAPPHPPGEVVVWARNVVIRLIFRARTLPIAGGHWEFEIVVLLWRVLC